MVYVISNVTLNCIILIKYTTSIFWDKVSIQHKYYYITLHYNLTDFLNNKNLFDVFLWY